MGTNTIRGFTLVFGLGCCAASGAACSQMGGDTSHFLQSSSALTGDGGGGGNASSKATAAINTVTVCSETSASAPCLQNNGTEGVWQNVMSTQLKTSGVADLFITPSLVTGIYTSTTVKGNGNGSTSSATAMGGVSVRVLLDGAPALAYPDETGVGVTFDERVQTLTANLGYILTDCLAGSDGGGTSGGFGSGCTLTPEQISLALQTTSAHSFGFIALNVGTGTHVVTVQARLDTQAFGTNGGTAAAAALYGLGSLTVESVRLVNSFSF